MINASSQASSYQSRASHPRTGSQGLYIRYRFMQGVAALGVRTEHEAGMENVRRELLKKDACAHKVMPED